MGGALGDALGEAGTGGGVGGDEGWEVGEEVGEEVGMPLGAVEEVFLASGTLGATWLACCVVITSCCDWMGLIFCVISVRRRAMRWMCRSDGILISLGKLSSEGLYLHVLVLATLE